jgi:hypothetical protein
LLQLFQGIEIEVARIALIAELEHGPRLDLALTDQPASALEAFGTFYNELLIGALFADLLVDGTGDNESVCVPLLKRPLGFEDLTPGKFDLVFQAKGEELIDQPTPP